MSKAEEFFNSLTEEDLIVLGAMIGYEKAQMRRIAEATGLTLKDNLDELLEAYTKTRILEGALSWL